ncbi:MAG: class I SAM-dependent methyltransferase [Egibacteraceae bacterium]
MSHYAFGDNTAAAQRLRLVAEIFAPTTTAFIARAVTRPPRLAVDVGCGPGHTTRLLAETTGATSTVGLDSSRAFLDLARRDAPGGVRFIAHDVTTVPFPVAAADVILARYILSHLPQPEAAAAAWRTQLAPGGVLLLEEVETIETSEPAFRAYLDVMTERMRAGGGELKIGPRLARLGQTSEVVSLRPTNGEAVGMFLLNLEAQGDGGPLRDGLLRIDPQMRTIEWRLRQVIVVK